MAYCVVPCMSRECMLFTHYAMVQNNRELGRTVARSLVCSHRSRSLAPPYLPRSRAQLRPFARSLPSSGGKCNSTSRYHAVLNHSALVSRIIDLYALSLSITSFLATDGVGLAKASQVCHRWRNVAQNIHENAVSALRRGQ